jgi:hypothetical protein
VGTWPGPSDTAMGATTPIRMPASLGSRVLLATEDGRHSDCWFELVEAHERAGDQREGEAPPGVPIPAPLQALPTAKPRQRPLEAPAVRAQPLRGFDPAPRDPRGDPTSPQRSPVSAAVVRLVRVELVWRWRRCPEGVRTAGTSSTIAASNVPSGCWPRYSRWQAAGQRRRSQGAAWILACHDRPDRGRRDPPTPATPTRSVR